jgi:hypothetical protein
MRSLLSRFGAWLNKHLHIVATDEESRIYDQIDRELRAKGQ